MGVVLVAMVLGLGACAGEDSGPTQDAVTADAGAEAGPLAPPPACLGTKLLSAYEFPKGHIECETDAFPPEFCGRCTVMTTLLSKSGKPEPLTCIIVDNCRKR